MFTSMKFALSIFTFRFMFFGFLSVGVLANGQDRSPQEDKPVLEGFDVVSYFDKDNPILGNPTLSSIYQGALYYFSSEENKSRFEKQPQQFLPQYGGWCAYGMARGKKVNVNPKAYILSNEKLYLFYSTYWVDTRSKWLKDPEGFTLKADQAWLSVKEK